MSSNIAITGVPTTPGSDGSVPLRREIRDLQQNSPDQFNLLVLGLKNLQGKAESDVLSYYQVAGIHGMPFKPWDGVGTTSDTDWQSTSGFGGYCTHSSILFLTWHRPYLALYEKSLYDAVQAVASQFPQGALRDKYVKAAQTFRAPYFDWATQPPQGGSAFPSIFTSANIQVVDVDGKTKSIPSPLYHFSFHPVNPSPGDFTQQWSRYPTTVRYPSQSGKSQDSRVAPILANELASLRSNVNLLLLSYTNYDAFSSNAWDPNTSPGAFGSVEDVHNEIHDRTGGNGHMSALEVSAFDPFFWLHHVNVDRLWTIWQELNPDSFMSAHPAPYSTFSVTGGDSQDQDTPLEPFYDKSGAQFWTSAQIKDTLTFGYAYPETQRWKFADEQSYQTGIRQAVTTLYGTNVFANFVDHVAQRKQEHAAAVTTLAATTTPPAAVSKQVSHGSNGHATAPLTAASTAVRALPKAAANAAASATNTVLTALTAPSTTTSTPSAAPASAPKPPPTTTTTTPTHPSIPTSLAHLAPNNTYTEWIVNIRAEKHGLAAPFRVLVFLGRYDTSDPSSWDIEFNVVGRVSVLGRNTATTTESGVGGGCGKCRGDAARGLLVSGTVPLTSALLQDIVDGDKGVGSLLPEQVVPHLRRELSWRVTLFDGTEKDVTQVPGLEVSVASTEVTIGEDGLPRYSGVYRVWPEVTDGKPAGLRASE